MLIFLLSTCVLFVANSSPGSAQDIRLVGGSANNEGRVEVFRRGQWQTVCDDSWDLNEANVACRQLGYGYAIRVVTNALFGQGTGGQWEASFSCTGSESGLEYCFTSSASCSHSEDVGVICSNSSSVQDIRLVGGSMYNEGRVEVLRSGQWQTVCDDGWDLNEANIVCRQLGYGYAIGVVTGAAFGEGIGEQWEASFTCFGSESRLEYCLTSSSSCSHSEDVGVICSTSSLQQGSLRLAGSTLSTTYSYDGRLEIYVSGQWGTICDDLWGNNEAIVACKQMGFEGAYDSDWTLGSSGSSSQTIWLDDVTCTGSESQLINCSHRGLGVEDCGHSEDVWIRCTRSVTSTPPFTISFLSPPVRRFGIIESVLLAGVFLYIAAFVIVCIVVVCCVQRRKRARRTARTPVTTTAGTTVAVPMVNQQPQQQQVVYQPQPNYQQQQEGYTPPPDYQQQQEGYTPPPDYQQQQGGYSPPPDYQQQFDYPGQQPSPVPSYPQPTDPIEDSPPPYPY